jgi:KRAB domain-containing zinc finger protein
MSQPSKETPAKPLVCEICNRSFAHRKYLQTHVREIHNTPAEPFICEICNRSYAVRRYLKSHIRRVHKSIPYGCDDCGTVFSNEDHLLQHACEFHIEEMKAAQMNAFSFSSVALAALQAVCAHEKDDLESQELEADVEMGDSLDTCESQQQTSTLLSQMDQSEIQATDMIGTSSDLGSSNQQTLINSHVGNQPSSANSDKPFACDLCDKRYLHERDMLYHRREVHTHGKQFKCEECDKAYARQDKLNFHYCTVHLGERRFKCEDCGTAFCQRPDMNLHYRVVQLGK